MTDFIRILLAEDEPAILRGLSATIHTFEEKYAVIGTACDGADALEKILKLKPDIVITEG